MILPPFTTSYETWAPVLARIIFAFIFLMSAFFKIPGSESFEMQVAMSGNVGIPFPLLAVTLAFILEVVAGIALLIGWHTRIAALLLALFTFVVALFFYRDWSDQMTMGLFISCLGYCAGLLYISVYGARYFALRKDMPSPLTQTLVSTTL